MNELAELDVMEQETTDIAITSQVKAALELTLRPVADRLAEYQQAAQSIVVANKSDATSATEICERIAADIKTVKSDDVLSKITDGLFKLHRRATAFRELFLAPMERDRKAIKGKVLAWQAVEAAKAAAIQAKLQAEADAKAQREREKQEAEARRQREIEETARRKAEDARRAAAAAEGAERDRLTAAANAAERAANAAAVKAEARTEQAAAVIAPTVVVEAAKSGLRVSKAWKVKAIDHAVFFAALATREDLRGFVDVATTRMERAKSANPSAGIPGVEFELIIR